MLHKNPKPGKQTRSPWSFRPDATTLAIWPDILSAHPTQNASRIINDALKLHGAEATRLLLLAEKAKLEAVLARLAAPPITPPDTSPPALDGPPIRPAYVMS